MVAARSAGSRMRVAHLKHARDSGGLLAWQIGHSTRRSCMVFTIAICPPKYAWYTPKRLHGGCIFGAAQSLGDAETARGRRGALCQRVPPEEIRPAQSQAEMIKAPNPAAAFGRPRYGVARCGQRKRESCYRAPASNYHRRAPVIVYDKHNSA